MKIKDIINHVNTYGVKIVFDSPEEVAQKILDGYIIYFTPVEGKEKKEYEKNKLTNFPSSSAMIHIPDLELDDLIDAFKCDGSEIYETTRKIVSPFVSENISEEIVCVIFIFLHEVGHWVHFSTMNNNVCEYVKADAALYEVFNKNMESLSESRNERFSRGINCPLTARERKLLMQYRDEYRQIPKEKRADEFALAELKTALEMWLNCSSEDNRVEEHKLIGWQQSDKINYSKLLSEFQRYGIDSSKPGFYDDQAFIAVERMQPDYLNKYAAFINSKGYSSEYLFYAKENIPIIANALYNELKKDGRLGACSDISALLSRCLEEEGFWNYTVAGPLTINFSPNTGIKDKYFWAVDKDLAAGSVAHSWVVAPPYTVIDLSINLQPYKEGEEQYLPDYIISNTTDVADYSVGDIIAPEIRAILQHRGIASEINMLQNTVPHALTMINQFPPQKIVCDNAELKYITLAVKAPDCSFKEMANITLCGKGPYETYQTIIFPILHDD